MQDITENSADFKNGISPAEGEILPSAIANLPGIETARLATSGSSWFLIVFSIPLRQPGRAGDGRPTAAARAKGSGPWRASGA
jgi:3-polyprenyl-4-hydroxybenzoate decarboxylase